jgi:hypothetical protein
MFSGFKSLKVVSWASIIPVDDVVAVAVVDALQDLLHEHGRVLLGELAARDDLVKQLAALANPANF